MRPPPLAPDRSTPGPLAPPLVLSAEMLYKRFVLHHQGGVCLPVLQGVSLTVAAGQCVALQGKSGAGKSTFLRSLYGNYRIDGGAIWVKHQGQWVNLAALEPHHLLAVRRHTIGYVSQFLRVIPRVPALTVAAEPLLALGVAPERADATIRQLFTRLNLPERLWELSPTTFSGGEKQRVNIARAFSVPYPILLLDEPTAALDAENAAVVLALIAERKAQGSGIVGIFHEAGMSAAVCDRALIFGNAEDEQERCDGNDRGL